MTATVLMISPGYPAEMPFFTRGLARAGARVIGAGDQHVSGLPDMARDHLAAYWQIPSLRQRGPRSSTRWCNAPPASTSTMSRRCGSPPWCWRPEFVKRSAFQG